MTRPGRAAAPASADPLFAVAMLRIALELKKSPSATLESAVDQVVARMGLPAEAFGRYLEQNLGLLRATTQRAFASAVSAPAQAVPAPARPRRTQRG